MATTAQVRVYNNTRLVCQINGIPQSTLLHKRTKGTVSAPSATGNTVYTGPGPLTNFAAQFQIQTPVWWVHQSFIRGEEREEDWPVGIESVPMLEAQIPAIDDSGSTVSIAQDDFIQDSNNVYWRVVNPTIAPDQSFWAFMAEMQR